MNNYIPKEVFGAVMYAKKLLLKGKRREVAIEVAAKVCSKDEEEIEEYIDVPLIPKKYCWSIIFSKEKGLEEEIFEVNIGTCYTQPKYALRIKEYCENKNTKYKNYSCEIAPDLYEHIADAGNSLKERLDQIKNKEMDEQYLRN